MKKGNKKGSSPSAVVGDLPLIQQLYKKVFSLFKTTGYKEDSRQQHSGMTLCYERQAFTLIELLVVVLIIGILAAVALPQYQKAVEKSRAAQALVLLKALDQAQRAYYLANGTYSNSFAELDVSVPWSGSDTAVSNQYWTIDLYNATSDNGYIANRIYATRRSGPYENCGFVFMYDTFRNQVVCFEPTTRTNSGDYCQKLFAGTKLDGHDIAYFWSISY